jgi:hypothetical protein
MTEREERSLHCGRDDRLRERAEALPYTTAAERKSPEHRKMFRAFLI